MKENSIEISGIITQDNINSYNLNYPRREICEAFGINFTEDMASVANILQVFFDTKVIKSKVTYTQGENKVFSHGIITTKIVYVADNQSSTIESVEFHKHFSCVLPINNKRNEEVTAKVFIEDAIIVAESDKDFYVSLLLLVCPVYYEELSKYEEVKTSPVEESISEISPAAPVKNKDVDIEVEYDMSMKNQYFESNWK